ncbi:MAG TPA: pyrroloquinoline quinone biosynthesis peptide chaperone PqqD [Rhodopila sp.]|jgi:pyrroloquinoline quinone biosynthesis protein D|nr:pyrroloquinoline quinone biosynthesis peptide chaperone PqqD [Rhodopila sp.]
MTERPVPERPVPQRPRLAAGVRLHFDNVRSAWVLLSPERVIQAEGPASEILKRCDGKHSVDDIVDELAALFTEDRAVIAQDVIAMLEDMVTRGLLTS